MFPIVKIQLFGKNLFLGCFSIKIFWKHFYYLRRSMARDDRVFSRKESHDCTTSLCWTPQTLHLYFSELGTRQFCRDNVTMLPCHTVVYNCHYTIFIVATPSRHWGLTIFRFFSGPWLVPEAILRCRVVIVAKLKNCRMPSSGIFIKKKEAGQVDKAGEPFGKPLQKFSKFISWEKLLWSSEEEKEVI